MPVVADDVDDAEREIHAVRQIDARLLVVHGPDVRHRRGGGGVDELPSPARVVAQGEASAGADHDVAGTIGTVGDAVRLELVDAELIVRGHGVARIRRVVDHHAVQHRVGPAREGADPARAVVVADLDSGLAVGAAVVPGGHIYRLEVAGAEIELPRDLHVPGYLRQIARYGYPRPTPVGALP